MTALRPLLVLVVLAASGCASAGDDAARRLAPFTTDGCSLFPDRSPDRSPDGRHDWCDCCVAHDLAYWRGGTADERLAADEALRACVLRKTGNDALARTMFLGVRTGGGPELETPFRWGYGWPYDGRYHALTPAESARADVLEKAYRARDPLLTCPSKPAPPAASAPG